MSGKKNGRGYRITVGPNSAADFSALGAALSSMLREAAEGRLETCKRGFVDAMFYVAGEAVKNAPVDTGDLRGSAVLTLDGRLSGRGAGGKSGDFIPDGGAPETAENAVIGFYTKYALDQHEQVGYRHPIGGRAKYLEAAVLENQDRILRTVASGGESG